MASMTPVLTRKQKQLIASGKLTEKQIKRMKDSADTWKFEQPAGKDRNGKRIRHTETFHGTKSEARKALAKFEAYWGSRRVSDRTLGGYIDEYMERKKGTIADSSYYALEKKMETIKYMFGADTKLSQITPVVIDDTLDELYTKGGKRGRPTKASYVASIKSVFSGVLQDAVRHNALVSNPMEFTEHKYQLKSDRRKLPPSKTLIEVMRQLDVRIPQDMAIMLALCCGLRRQEACALKFDDIDEEAGVIHIRRSIRADRSGEWVEEHTKTESGMRDLPMPGFLPGMLKRRRRTIEEDIEVALRSKAIEERPDELYVCATDKGERLKLSTITHYWSHRRGAWNVNCSFHDLRHCYTSSLARAKVPVVTASKIVGHKNPSVTLDVYSHCEWDDVVEAVESVSALFEEGLVEYPPPPDLEDE